MIELEFERGDLARRRTMMAIIATVAVEHRVLTEV